MALTNPGNTVRLHSRNQGRASVYEANMWAQRFTSGLYSGNGVLQNTPSANMNVKVGGTTANPDVYIAMNASGYRIALDLVSQQTILLQAPATNSRIASIVAYSDDLSINSVDTTTTGNQSSCGLIVVYGSTSASPVAPTDSAIRSAITADGATGSQACYTIMANITLASTTTVITQSMIDSGKFSSQMSGGSLDQGWANTGQALTYTGNNGNKEYTGTFPTDMTLMLSPGMKLKVTRSITPPTQSMAFTAANSHYATKSSPAGLSFTTTYSCEAWVFLNSYTSTNQGIMSRYDGTNGFLLWLDNVGRLSLSAGSSTLQTTQQGLPKKQWVHVAATFASGTFNLYINGILVPSTKSGSATSITQAGNLQLGALNSVAYFDGYISEARIWSTVLSQATIQANMNSSLAGSESGLVALFQGNGNFTDKTSNANTLTATNGAIATQSANPMNPTEYAIITKVGTYSGGVTPVTLFTGTDCNIPNQSLSNALYSSSSVPQGFPASSGKWAITMPINASQDKTTGLARWILQNPNGVCLQVPTGAWKVKGQLLGLMTSSTGQTFNNLSMAVSPSTTIDITNTLPFSRLFANSTLSLTSSEHDAPMFYVEDTLEFSAMTPLYILVGSSSPNLNLIRIMANTSVTIESAYVK